MQTRIRAGLHLTCQRCLAPMAWRINHKNRVVIMTNQETARSLPRATDHVVCPSEEIAPAELVEEEILLLLPHIPLHASVDQCDADVIARLHRRDTPKTRDNPFAALKNIRL